MEIFYFEHYAHDEALSRDSFMFGGESVRYNIGRLFEVKILYIYTVELLPKRRSESLNKHHSRLTFSNFKLLFKSWKNEDSKMFSLLIYYYAFILVYLYLSMVYKTSSSFKKAKCHLKKMLALSMKFPRHCWKAEERGISKICR